MNRILLLLLMPILAFSTTFAATKNNQKFTISGCIDGLENGDTLSFHSIEFPNYTLSPKFNIIVGSGGQFVYKGSQPNSQFYLITYSPKEGAAPICDRRGREVFITDGDKLILSGTRQFVLFCTYKGGIYNNPILSRVVSLEDSLGMVRTTYLQKRDKAQLENNIEAVKEYAAKLINFRPGSAIDTIEKLWKDYYNSPNTSELAAINLIRECSYAPYKSTYDGWKSLPINIQQSYYGKMLDQQLQQVGMIQTGQPAIDFTLVAESPTEKVSLSDFKGKYLLIYHWGLCPGSMAIDPSVKDLYNKASDKLAIIGVSSNIDEIKEIVQKMPPTDSLSVNNNNNSPYGFDVGERLNGMLNHPYADYNLNIEQNNIDDIYRFAGLPFFVLISPDGKISERGFSDVFNKIYDTILPQNR